MRKARKPAGEKKVHQAAIRTAKKGIKKRKLLKK